MKERLFLIGGSGFIGKNLVRSLYKQYNIYVYDKFVDLEYFSHYPNVTTNLIELDKDKIGEDEYVYGENLYGEHSIHYDNLTSYFYMFAARDNDNWYSWMDVELMAEILNVPTVPVLFEGTINTEKELRDLIDDIMSKPSTFGAEKEGVVIRHAEAFPVEVDGESVFHKNVCKWVRPHHVQTDSHWTRYWKKAEIKRY